jgi:hypothetical protein
MSSVLATRPNSVASKICACGERHLEPLVDRLEDVVDRDRRLGGERGRELRASAISSPAGTTRLTSPMRCASGAVIWSPDSSSSSARPLPTSRARRCVPA